MDSAAVRVAAGSPATAARIRPTLRLPAWVLGAFALAIAVAYLGFLGQAGLAEPDESRYGEIARELLELGDWVTPHLNYVKYFEKPPLVYWLTALNEHCFGFSEFVVRLWPAVFGLLGIGLADLLGRSMYGRWNGHLAAGLLATTPLYFGLSQVLVLDMPLSTLLAVALTAFWFAYTAAERRSRRRWVVLIYVATALAVLTKGPVAVLLVGGIITAFVLVRWDVAALRWMLSPLGIGLFLIIGVPWFVLVSHRNPEFVDFFVFKQHVARFLTPDEHRQGVWFFVPIVWAGMLPWSLFLLAPRRLARFSTRLLARRTSAATVLCTLWAAVVFVFFSLSGSKLATYILPMFWPLALLASRFFESVVMNGRSVLLRRGCVALTVMAVAIAIGTGATVVVVDDPRARALLPFIWAGAAVLGATAVAALLLARRGALQATLATLTLGMLAVQAVAITARGAVSANYRPLALAIRAQARPDDVVINYRHYVQSIPFYAQRRVVMVGGRGELDFGSRQGDQRAFFWDTDEALLDAWASPRRLFVVINRSELEPLRPRLQPAPRQIAQHGKKVLIVNFS